MMINSRFLLVLGVFTFCIGPRCMGPSSPEDVGHTVMRAIKNNDPKPLYKFLWKEEDVDHFYAKAAQKTQDIPSKEKVRKEFLERESPSLKRSIQRSVERIHEKGNEKGISWSNVDYSVNPSVSKKWSRRERGLSLELKNMEFDIIIRADGKEFEISSVENFLKMKAGWVLEPKSFKLHLHEK